MSVEAIEKKKTLAEFSILNSIQMLNASWGKVMTRTAVNCSKKSCFKILKGKQSKYLLDADNAFKDLQE